MSAAVGGKIKVNITCPHLIYGESVPEALFVRPLLGNYSVLHRALRNIGCGLSVKFEYKHQTTKQNGYPYLKGKVALEKDLVDIAASNKVCS